MTTKIEVLTSLYSTEMQRLIDEIAPYYEGEEERLKTDISLARRNQTDTTGDLSVIAWVSGQLTVLKLIKNRPRKQKK